MTVLARRQKRTTMIIWLILIIAMAVIIFSSIALYKLKQSYQESDSYYEKLQSLVHIQDEQYRDIPALAIDFVALKEINGGLIGWLYSPGTKINYPVVLADNYDWYFRHLLDDSEGIYGTPFLDIDGKANFDRKVTAVYGKKIKDGKMFGSLLNYKEQDYFEEYPYIYLYTEQKNYRIELIYGCTVSEGEWRERAFMYEANLESLLGYGKANTTFESNVEYKADDKFIVLNALEKGYNEQSYFVIGVLRPV